MPRRAFLRACLLVPLMAGLPAAAVAADGVPSIRIVEPSDGTVVNGPVAVRVEVLNVPLQAPGSGPKPSAGHIHYWIDDGADALISGPTTQTEIRLFVSPGRHQIRAELVLDDHPSLAEGHRGKKVLRLPHDDPAFARRSSMSTITVDVR